MVETQTSVKDVIPDVGNEFSLDDGVLTVFPEGSKVVESISFGTAAWTRASRLTIELPDGEQKSYFLKCATNELGRNMMEGEHRSMSEIYSYMPEFVPQPITWGRFQKASPETFFFLMEFVNLGREIVEPTDFCRSLVQLHKTSSSPTGKFGFHQTTFQGPNPQNTTWESNWCTYFVRLLTEWLDREISLNGPQLEYEGTYKQFVQKIVPQILEPLQSEGRILKPSLIHGDLWEENTGLNLRTQKPVVFDACTMYAHNEMELGMWRNERNRFGKPYFIRYFDLMPPSEPIEQCDDRNRLYAMKYTLSHCQVWPDASQSGRQLILNDMRYLIAKYNNKP